jgi:tight adherence protein C
VSALVAWSIPVGVALGLGLWTLVATVPRVGAPRLAARIAPYLTDISPVAQELATHRRPEPATFVAGLLAPAVARAIALLAGILGGNAVVERRLRQAGWRISVESFRARQLLGGVIGAAVGVAAGAVALRTSTPPVALVLAGIALVLGVVAPDMLLGRAARARRERIAAELPTVLEFLALALAAGEGILDALRRVARIGRGDLAAEIGRVVAEVHSGVPLTDALRRCADEIQLPALGRTVDQLVGALDRGTPLADVLRAQAQDSRDDAKRLLLESAGRREVAMLVPLVFGLLPVTVAFAIFPGLLVLRLGF